jgi:hypothetical protein
VAVSAPAPAAPVAPAPVAAAQAQPVFVVDHAAFAGGTFHAPANNAGAFAGGTFHTPANNAGAFAGSFGGAMRGASAVTRPAF